MVAATVLRGELVYDARHGRGAAGMSTEVDIVLDRPAQPSEHQILNMRPQHPSTHGVLRLVLELDGEIIVSCTPVVGYLHRAMEKIGESMTFHMFTPYTDRLDYLAPLANNVALSCAQEHLLGVDIPPRAKAIRRRSCTATSPSGPTRVGSRSRRTSRRPTPPSKRSPSGRPAPSTAPGPFPKRPRPRATGGSRSALKRRTGLRPMIRHPPGVSTG